MKPHDDLDDDARERAALYAMRALPIEEAAAFETHLARCAACRAEADSLARVCDELAVLASPVTPPPLLRGRVIERIRGDESARPLVPPFSFVRAAEGDWLPTPFQGIELRVLFTDEANDRVTMLMRMAAGSAFPSHRHGDVEECYVLEGDLLSGDVPLRAGDYQRAEAHSIHQGQSTRGGCLLLVTGSTRDELLDGTMA